MVWRDSQWLFPCPYALLGRLELPRRPMGVQPRSASLDVESRGARVTRGAHVRAPSCAICSGRSSLSAALETAAGPGRCRPPRCRTRAPAAGTSVPPHVERSRVRPCLRAREGRRPSWPRRPSWRCQRVPARLDAPPDVTIPGHQHPEALTDLTRPGQGRDRSSQLTGAEESVCLTVSEQGIGISGNAGHGASLAEQRFFRCPC